MAEIKITSKYKFGNNKETADALADLVLKGTKTATCSRYIEDAKISKVGEFSIIQNFDGKDLCIVETVSVDIIPFNKVSADFAYKEGEGDRSLKYWSETHKKFFEEEGVFSEDMLLECEVFKLVKVL